MNVHLKAPVIETSRLTLEPVRREHAVEMVSVLADAELYTYLPHEPPTLAYLEELYERWSHGLSRDGTEFILNWMARLRSTGALVGHFQSSIPPSRIAPLGYTVGLKFQRQGFALEALQAVIAFLKSSGRVSVVKAWIDTRNRSSIKLVEKLGMTLERRLEAADEFKGSKSDEFVYALALQGGTSRNENSHAG
jgi:ribosomal-protein-alanine N-acetyltransferase